MSKVDGYQAIMNSHNVHKELHGALWKLCLTIINNMNINGRNATGRTRKSLQIKTTPLSGQLWGLRSLVWMETGRRPGGKPPTTAIYEWLKGKKIRPKGIKGKGIDEKRRKLSYIIASAIQAHGTELHRIGLREEIYTTEARKTVAKLANRFIMMASSDVDALNERFAKL